VKVKLSLLGVAVDKCAICLYQFREGEDAVRLSWCRHSFYARCLTKWILRSKTC
ncbi:hypothetical protein K474DRAFT_1560819, partial [Panus rudis PR-1116 ss-1]